MHIEAALVANERANTKNWVLSVSDIGYLFSFSEIKSLTIFSVVRLCCYKSSCVPYINSSLSE